MSTNYSNNRYSTLVHNVPDDLADRKGMTAKEFIDNEREKQHNELVNWHSHARSRKSTCSSVSLRSEFSAARNPVEQSRLSPKLLLLIPAVVVFGAVMFYALPIISQAMNHV